MRGQLIDQRLTTDRSYHGDMHFSFAHSLVVAALIASIVLLMHRDDKLFPVLALVASGLEALQVFNVVSLSSGRFRIELVLGGLLAVAGVVCWMRSDGKPSITAATVASLVGILQVLIGLNVMS